MKVRAELRVVAIKKKLEKRLGKIRKINALEMPVSKAFFKFIVDRL